MLGTASPSAGGAPLLDADGIFQRTVPSAPCADQGAEGTTKTQRSAQRRPSRSGSTEHDAGIPVRLPICKRYPARGVSRKMLVQAAWIGQLTNPWMQETFQRISGGKTERKKKAIVAVARRLFVRLWAMDRSGQDWNGPAAVVPDWRQRRKIPQAAVE